MLKISKPKTYVTTSGSIIFILGSILVLISSACSPREKTAEELKLEIEAKTKIAEIKANRTAEFIVESHYKNCELGYMTWLTNKDYERGSPAIICNGTASSSITYREGKQSKSILQAETFPTLEELEIEHEKIKREEALKKLTDEEKKVLGLVK